MSALSVAEIDEKIALFQDEWAESDSDYADRLFKTAIDRLQAERLLLSRPAAETGARARGGAR